MIVSGVYEIRNTLDDKVYIGSSKNVAKRLSTHKYDLKRGAHFSKHMQAAWDKHGSECFRFRLLLVCAQKDLFFYEQLVTDGFKSNVRTNGYNKLLFVDSPRGMKLSAEHKLKMVAAIPKGVNHYGFGKPPSDAARAASSAANKHPMSEATKARLSATKMGRSMPSGVAERMAVIRTGARTSQATRDKQRASHAKRNDPHKNENILAMHATGIISRNEIARRCGVSPGRVKRALEAT